MKLTRNLKKHLLPVCLVLAFALLLGLTLNLYKPLKQLTQKKVPNPENLLNDESIIIAPVIKKNGITFEQNKDGSIHVFGTSDSAFGVCLTLDYFSLEAGKTYMLSSGLKQDSLKSYYLRLVGNNGKIYYGNLNPENPLINENHIYGPFVAGSGDKYQLDFYVVYPGAVIDEVLYPCLVEGTEPGDFYIYK